MKVPDKTLPRQRRPTRWPMIMNLALSAILALALPVRAQNSDDRVPFGPLDEVDMDQLIKFGRARGFELQPELERIYKKDERALRPTFQLVAQIQEIRPERASVWSSHIQLLFEVWRALWSGPVSQDSRPATCRRSATRERFPVLSPLARAQGETKRKPGRDL